MEKQFKNYTTFFDYNMEEDEEKDFVTVYNYVKGSSTARYRRNKAAIRYLKGEEISTEDKKVIDSYFDGSINEIQRKQYKHCLLCTDKFERKILKELSDQYKYWEICFPTNPYTPGGLMIYLKDRERNHLENIGEISQDTFKELLVIIKDLYSKLNNSLGENQIVGINVLFNQISKTQKCIHGHIEPMIREVDKLNVGSEIKKEEPVDKLAGFLNEQVKEQDGVYKLNQGVRIDLDRVSIDDAQEITEKYRKNICTLREYVTQLRNSNHQLTSKQQILAQHFNPAPVQYIYITYYRDKMFLSIVPEVFLEKTNIYEVGETEKELYGFRISDYGETLEEKILIQRPPLVRPCFKVSTTHEIEKNIKMINRKISSSLEMDKEVNEER